MAVEAHLADCAWCRQQLATYDVVDEALRRHYSAQSVFGAGGQAHRQAPVERPIREVPPMRGIVSRASVNPEADEWERLPLSPSGAASVPSPGSTGAYSSLTPLVRVAFVLVLGALALGLFARLGGLDGAVRTVPAAQAPAAGVPVASGLPTTSTAPLVLDQQAQAYILLLHTYYQPLYAELVGSITCDGAYTHAMPGDRLAALLSCRDVEMAVVASAQTLSRHLQVATPPARWQLAHLVLIQAVQATSVAYQQRIAAIDAHSSTLFDQAIVSTPDLLRQFCDPIIQVNAALAMGDLLDAPTAVCFTPPSNRNHPYTVISR
jgi:hypothetical protein